MEDGYYWAKFMGESADPIEWEVVEVWGGNHTSRVQDVSRMGSEVACLIEDFEFGEKIERKT